MKTKHYPGDLVPGSFYKIDYKEGYSEKDSPDKIIEFTGYCTSEIVDGERIVEFSSYCNPVTVRRLNNCVLTMTPKTFFKQVIVIEHDPRWSKLKTDGAAGCYIFNA